MVMSAFFIRYRVIAMSAPRIATQYAVKRQPATIYKPVLLQGLNRIVGAGGRKAANTRGKR